MSAETSVRVITADCRAALRDLPDSSVQAIVTSPPYYGLRDYGVAGQIGQEDSLAEYVGNLTAVFREARRVLRDDGTLWLNLGDSYGSVGGDTYHGFNRRWSGTGGHGSKQDATLTGVKDRILRTGLVAKNLLGVPWRVAFALQADGWILRQDIIWHKPNPMPESVRDRCTKAHEYLFLLSKAERYFFDTTAMQEDAVYGARGSEYYSGKTLEYQSGRTSKKKRESRKRGEFDGKTNEQPGREAFRAIRDTRNRRSVWTVATKPYAGAHFATFPPDLIAPCILAGSKPGDVVLDPFGGAGTTGLVAHRLQRRAVLIELNPAYAEMARARVRDDAPLLATGSEHD
ncbi:MAG: site-specific DNA-methyltransferase [Alphaproteobacteria bacterium]|nr:MAG: site-specific DNA-methyltransferase [Alphaproteobacteria bacterium]